jgi:hypothetical protein
MFSRTLDFVRFMRLTLSKSMLESLNYVILDHGLHEMNTNNLIKAHAGEPQPCPPGPWASCD